MCVRWKWGNYLHHYKWMKTYYNSSLSLSLSHLLQGEECDVSGVPAEAGETQAVPASEHAVLPPAAHATHHEAAPANSGHIEQDSTRPPRPQTGGECSQNYTEGQ